MKKLFSQSAVVCLVASLVAVAGAQENIKVETVLAGLDNPSGLAVQPKTGHIFVSVSGASKVIRVDPAKPKEPTDVITDFPKGTYGKGPIYNIGPLGLAFLDKSGKVLVVGGGGLEDGKELVRVYDVPEVGKPIKADKMKQALGPIVPDGEIKGEGNFYALAVTPAAIYATSNGDDTKGWIVRSEVKAGKIGKLERWLATKEATNVDAPVGIAINRKGHVVIGQMGEITKPKDSLLTFYSPDDRKKLMNLETGLYDITALAYGPTRPQKISLLYCLDFAWMAEDEGGLFRIDAKLKDDKTIGMKTIKLSKIIKPTAMAFADDGTLYVTCFDKAKEGEKTGKLLKITGAIGAE